MNFETKCALDLLIQCCKENQEFMNKLFPFSAYEETGRPFCEFHGADSRLIGIDHDERGNVSFYDFKEKVNSNK